MILYHWQDAASGPAPPPLSQEALFEELFSGGDQMSAEAQQQFEDQMRQLMGDQTGLAQQFEHLARMAGEAG